MVVRVLNNLPITEELDFHYLLTLMPPLTDMSEYQWLPELFSIIGYEQLITLTKYAGGELIRIPTLDELAHAIESLQYFYDYYIKHILTLNEIPADYKATVEKIVSIYDAKNS